MKTPNRRTAAAILTVMTFLLGGARLAICQEPGVNLVANSSFEQLRPGIRPRLPAAWVPEYSAVGDRPQLIKDPARAHRGDRFLRLAGQGKWMKMHAIGHAGSAPPLEGGKAYTFRAWARSADVADASLEFQPSGETFVLTPEWREYETTWQAPESLTKLNTGFFLKAYGPVDVDDVVICPAGSTVLPPTPLQIDRTGLNRLAASQAWERPRNGSISGERITIEVTNIGEEAAGNVLIPLSLRELFGTSPSYDFVSPEKLHVLDSVTGGDVPFALQEVDLQPGLGDDLLVFAATLPAFCRKDFYLYLSDREPVGTRVIAEAQLPGELGKLARAPESVSAEVARIERLGTLVARRDDNGKVNCRVTAPEGSRVTGRVQSPDKSHEEQVLFRQETDAPIWSADVALPGDAAGGIWSVEVDLSLPDGTSRAVAGAFVEGAGLWAAGNLHAVRSDDAPRPQRGKANLFAARGERESLQVVIAAEQHLRDVTLAAGTLRQVNGDGEIPADCWTLERVVELYVGIVHPAPTYRLAGDQFVNAGNYPDPLLPWREHDVKAGTQRVCLATLRVPDGVPAGDYRGEITARAADGTRLVLPVKLHVYDFDMPTRSRFPILVSARTAYVGVPGDREGQLGKDVRYYHLWDQEAADELAFFVAGKWLEPAIADVLQAGAIPWTYDEKARQATIDSQRFDENVGKLINEYGVHRVYTTGWDSGWRSHGSVHTFPPLEQWPDGWGTAYKTSPDRVRKSLGTQEGLDMLEDWSRAVGRHLEEKGWLDRVSFYIFDEPKSQEVAETILAAAKARRRGHPGIHMWGAGYGNSWRPYFDYLDLFTGTMQPDVRQKLKQEGIRYFGIYNQTINILPIPRMIGLVGGVEGWDGYYHHETTSNQDLWINPEPPIWANRYTPKFVAASRPNSWMLLAGSIYHWPVDELREPLPEGKQRAWASSLRIEAFRESAEDATYLMMLREYAQRASAKSSTKQRLEAITSRLSDYIARGQVTIAHNWYYNYRLDEDELGSIRRQLCKAVESARIAEESAKETSKATPPGLLRPDDRKHNR